MRELVIREQRHPDHFGNTPLSYGVFMVTDEVVEDLEYWQGEDCADYFLCYAWSLESAQRAIAELSTYL